MASWNSESVRKSFSRAAKDLTMWKRDFNFCTDSDDDDLPLDSEKVMKDIQKFYTAKHFGLRDAARAINDKNFDVTVPRQKITVLLFGHHTAAKQKFLDLYFDDSRQGSFISKVNLQRMDKIFIAQGNPRKWLSGETVLDYCPHLAKLKNVPGLKDYLTTEICTRQTKSLVSFILAPAVPPSKSGSCKLIGDDGETQDLDLDLDANNNINPNPCTLGPAIETLVDAADLIFVFFDPSGVIHPKETLKPLKDLWEKHHDKIHLLLAKANDNECPEESREDTLALIVREAWRVQEIRKVGYLPIIYCPDLTSRVKDDERLWGIIKKATDESVQRALLTLERDARKVKELLLNRLKNNERLKQTMNAPSTWYLWFFVVVAVLLAMSVTELNEIVCASTDNDWKHICGEFVSNKTFIACIGVATFLCTIRSLIMDRQPILLSPDEEDLLNKRIQFAHKALCQKEVMEKTYLANSF